VLSGGAARLAHTLDFRVEQEVGMRPSSGLLRNTQICESRPAQSRDWCAQMLVHSKTLEHTIGHFALVEFRIGDEADHYDARDASQITLTTALGNGRSMGCWRPSSALSAKYVLADLDEYGTTNWNEASPELPAAVGRAHRVDAHAIGLLWYEACEEQRALSPWIRVFDRVRSEVVGRSCRTSSHGMRGSGPSDDDPFERRERGVEENPTV
jgi:hypothetical protein